MNQAIRSASIPSPHLRHFVRLMRLPPLGVSLFLAMVFALSGLTALGGLTGCKAVDLTPPPSDTTHQTHDSAVISITNQITLDKDSLVFYYYDKAAVEVTNSVYEGKLGGVGVNGTITVKVPVGTWKLAYANSTGVLFPMQDVNDPGLQWLKGIFAKGGKYSLILKTDGNDNIWVPTFVTDPPIQ